MSGELQGIKCGLQSESFRIGCGQAITHLDLLYRCATCDVAMHKTCLHAHFNWRDDLVPTPSNVERLAVAERDAAALLADRDRLAEFAQWLAAMDNPADVLAREERRSVTLTRIIDRARAALAAGGVPERDTEPAGEELETAASAVVVEEGRDV